jgi:hypothetical protein
LRLGQTGIVDQDADRAKRRLRRIERRWHSRCIGNIQFNGDRLAAVLANAIDQFFQPVDPACRHHDLRAIGSQCAGKPLAQAGRRPRDEGNFTAQIE